MGVYPMLADNTCSFLAADFDEGDWRRDAFAFRDACERHGIPVAIERSRSGNGAHAWIFFDEPISATLARRLGAFLITDTMEHVPDIGFGSYDRFFPSQDFMPTGGFGNLIALPLQGLARSSGNSALEAGRSPVVITERTAHLEIIAKRLERFAKHVVVLRGGQSEKQRRDVAARLAAIPQAEERVIVATGRYLGEGFDDSRLDTLFLTMPIAWKGTLAQYAGRLHRLNDVKREVTIYDYADMRVPVLARMAAKRRLGYQAIGYKVLGALDLFSDRAATRTNPHKFRADR